MHLTKVLCNKTNFVHYNKAVYTQTSFDGVNSNFFDGNDHLGKVNFFYNGSANFVFGLNHWHTYTQWFWVCNECQHHDHIIGYDHTYDFNHSNDYTIDYACLVFAATSFRTSLTDSETEWNNNDNGTTVRTNHINKHRLSGNFQTTNVNENGNVDKDFLTDGNIAKRTVNLVAENGLRYANKHLTVVNFGIQVDFNSVDYSDHGIATWSTDNFFRYVCQLTFYDYVLNHDCYAGKHNTGNDYYVST